MIVQNDKTNDVYIWEMNDDWEFENSSLKTTNGSFNFFQTEQAFGLDLNTDGITGLVLNDLEVSGSTSLTTDEFGAYYAQDKNGGINDIRRNGNHVKSSWWKDWGLLAAENIDGTNQVIVQNDKTNDVYIWEMNDDWVFANSSLKTSDGTSEYFQVEQAFGLDLNNDGIYGSPVI